MIFGNKMNSKKIYPENKINEINKSNFKESNFKKFIDIIIKNKSKIKPEIMDE